MESQPTLPVLLVTANVGSIFEDPDNMLKMWTGEFLATVERLAPRFVALHCQEVGGKNYERSMRHVEDFIGLLTSSDQLRTFDKTRAFLDEDYSSAENFTALGNIYFIHESLKDVSIWNFKDSQFVELEGSQIHSGNIEAVVTKEKAKFPQDFFPECKWSRKGFMRTRWSINGTVFDMVNIHLFHDASNIIAMESCPSVYSANRKRALEHTLHRFHNDPYGRAPYFLFGDFNFRTDTDGVVKRLTEGLTETRIQNNKSGEYSKLQYLDGEKKTVLTVGKKEFNHLNHQTVFVDSEKEKLWLKDFDKEMDAFSSHMTEFDINFPPTYPFEEKILEVDRYMQTRCPSWCDRVLLSHTARSLVIEDGKLEYGLMGTQTCMGDHKPVYLRMSLRANAGIVKCCSHASYDCLPLLCRCCQSYASVTINVIDMSDYLVKKSFDNIAVDSNFLHEPITKDMLLHEPYTPESVDSHSPSAEKVAPPLSAIVESSTRRSVSPHELKTKLEDILRVENSRSRKFLMRRSASQYITGSTPAAAPGSVTAAGVERQLKERAMSDLGRRLRLRSDSSGSTNRLESHHSSSDEDWFEFDELLDDGVWNRPETECCTLDDGCETAAKIRVDDAAERGVVKEKKRGTIFRSSRSMKSKASCCILL